MRAFLLFSYWFLIALNVTNAAKILYIFPVGCKSSFLFHQKMIEILVNHGHDVTAISKFPQDAKRLNYTDIGVSEHLYSMADAISVTNNPRGSYENLYIPYSGQLQNCEKAYADNKIKDLLSEKFDLVLLEVAATKCFVPLAFSFRVPVIGVVAGAVVFSDFDGFIGNPGNPSYVPAIMSGVSPKMSFSQRVLNTYEFILHWLFRWYYTRQGDVVAQKYIKGTPPIEDLFTNTSLIFYNSHSTFLPQPLAPNTIEIAGIHLEKPRPLPKEIRDFVQNAPNGIIFVSLGSVVQFSSFPKEIHDIFLKVFSRLPYHIIWRHNKPEEIRNLPKNVLVHQWLPQNDILAEEKTVLFLSHCGIFSIYEAIHYSIPILCIPVLYDQFSNAAIMENLGIGLKIDYRNITEELLSGSIYEILNQKRFSDNIEHLSEKFNDRPLSAEETFIYWINYVIRFGGATHLKPNSSGLPFYKYLLLDVILFVILTLYFLTQFVYMSYILITTISFRKEKLN
ncbi:UDP-glucosyltransferase 2-like isoform X2 [Planococcus citri]|uniref:UDP-glucosyltransferase 2-like isoform X2 n=1 Tax=Planococcus citri TaxID=170843 RepID=UPI0031F74FD1